MDLKTWLLAYSALCLQTIPEESLRENRIISVSANLPEDIESFKASRRGSVERAIASTLVGTRRPLIGSQIRGAAAALYAMVWLAWNVWLVMHPAVELIRRGEGSRRDDARHQFQPDFPNFPPTHSIK